MATQTTQSGESDATAPPVQPIRSILKKVPSDSAVSDSESPRHKKSITFNESVTTHWTNHKVSILTERRNSAELAAKYSNGEPGTLTGSTTTTPLEGEDRQDGGNQGGGGSGGGGRASSLRNSLKSKVGGVFLRFGGGSGKSQVSEGEGEEGEGGDASNVLEECSGGTVTHTTDKKRTARPKRRSSDAVLSSSMTEPYSSHSLPRMNSFDSSTAELFTSSRGSRSLRKILKLGRHLKPGGGGGGRDGEPVLTKVTPLGGGLG